MSEAESITADEFWAELERCGVTLTDDYAAKGKARFCKKRDGELFTVSVYSHYPTYMANKVLEENGFFHVPMYNNAVN